MSKKKEKQEVSNSYEEDERMLKRMIVVTVDMKNAIDFVNTPISIT